MLGAQAPSLPGAMLTPTVRFVHLKGTAHPTTEGNSMQHNNDGRVSRAVGRALRQHERDVQAAKRLAKAASLPKPTIGPRKAA